MGQSRRSRRRSSRRGRRRSSMRRTRGRERRRSMALLTVSINTFSEDSLKTKFVHLLR
jgi:hypothetical protein